MISAQGLRSQPYAIDIEVKLIRFEEIQVLCKVTLKFYLPWKYITCERQTHNFFFHQSQYHEEIFARGQ